MEGLVVSRPEGRQIARGGMGVVFKVTGEDTSGPVDSRGPAASCRRTCINSRMSCPT